jgi:hypothetical protein
LVVLSAGGAGWGWSAGREVLQAGDRGGDLVCAWPAGGQAQPQPAAAAHQPPGDGGQPQSQPLGFPPAGGPSQGEHLHPGEQLAGQRGDLAPDLVLGEPVEGEVAQAGVLGGLDPVLTPGAAAVTQLEAGELPAFGAGREAGEPVPADVGEPQLRAGVGRSLRTMTRMPFGQPARSSRPVSSAIQAPSRTRPPAP